MHLAIPILLLLGEPKYVWGCRFEREGRGPHGRKGREGKGRREALGDASVWRRGT